MVTRKSMTVSQLNGYVKQLIENDQLLKGLVVEGEISNFKAHSSGHLYFALKDEKSSVRVVMFRSSAGKLKFRPENGQRVFVSGHVSVYERDGQYQLYAASMEPAGLGDLYLAFEQMKENLNREGLFALDHKRDLPLLPRAIGVVTSPTGAVWHDIQQVATARFPVVRLFLYPAAVQGDEAIPQVVAGINYFNRCRDDIDLLIVGRGGGSLEDLWAFNTEPVARAIYDSRLPVISAVGHETDVTIADLVADRRAATPSQAAEFAVPVLSDLETRLAYLESGLRQRLHLYLSTSRGRIRQLQGSYIFQQPQKILQNQLQTVDMLSQRLYSAFQERFQRARGDYRLLAEKLAVLSPLQTMARGYSITTRAGKVVRSYETVHGGDVVVVLLAKGKLRCRVEKSEGGTIGDGREGTII